MIGKDQDSDIGKLSRWQQGQSGNPKGRPKGSKSLSKIVLELENEKFNWKQIPVQGGKLAELLSDLGSPWRAIVMKALTEGLKGNIKAMEWLRKSGYGDKLDITSKGKKIESPLAVSPVAKREHVTTNTETAEGN